MHSLLHELAMRYPALHIISFLVAGWLCCSVSNTFAQTYFDDITVTPELQPKGSTVHGYAEYRIGVSNRSPDNPHQVTLIFPKTSYSYSGENIREMTGSVLVGPSATVHVSLLQPPVPMHGHSLVVAIDGRRQEEEVPLPVGQHGRDVHMSYIRTPGGSRVHMGISSLSLQILISQNVDVSDLHAHAGVILGPLASRGGYSLPGSGFSPSSSGFPPSSGGRSKPFYETVDLGFPVSAWSTSWLGFSCYDGVVVTEDDIRTMPPDVQGAIWRYVECGGALFVLGGGELPDSWKLEGSLKSELSTESAEIAAYDVGFGQCIVSPEMDMKGLSQEQWRVIVGAWMQTALPWRWEDGIEEGNTLFSVVSSLGIPVRGLFFLMVLFAVAIGPINLIVLARKKRRIWMLWTAPVISVITCLAVFTYATFAEGWNRHARTEGLTILDERVHRATTIGWTAFYSALTPSEGLHFGYETELTPLAHSMTTNVARTVDWTHDQHLASGWVTARVPAHFMVRKSETRRERVTVRRGADTDLRIVNGLGADINQFWLADKDGTIFSATNIPAGTEAALTPFEKTGIDGSDEIFLFEIWIPLVNQELDKGNIAGIFRDEMSSHGILLSDDVTVSIEQREREWEITDRLLERSYHIKTSRPDGPLQIYDDKGTGWNGDYKRTSLRGIFASENWIENIGHLKINPQKYLRPGCYIATLEAAPFIEEGLQKVTEKRYSSIVYGILAEE